MEANKQKETLKAAFLRGERIDANVALFRYNIGGGFRARISELRREGLPILSVSERNRMNKGYHNVYYLDRGGSVMLDYCEWCGTDLYNNDYVYDGDVVCEKCFEYAYSVQAIKDFIISYPKYFKEYLDESEEYAFVKQMLQDYHDWRRADFDDWLEGKHRHHVN